VSENGSNVASPTKLDIENGVMGNGNNVEPNEMLLSNDLANILYSFNNLLEDNLFQGSLIRSASSAGETITRNNQIVHVSVPKRAETFNGASSSKENQHLAADINGNLKNLISFIQYIYSHIRLSNHFSRKQ
jgi:hypothetical protein